MKKVWIRFFCFFSFIAVLFSGCDMFNVEVVNYLKNYTETAAIEKDELVLTSGTASNGLRCVDSNGDRFVNLILRNPQGFVLKSEDQRIEINEALIGAGYTPATVPPPFIQQLSENRSALIVELSKQLLEAVDKGEYTDSVTGKVIKDISFSITLKANVSGTIRTFGTYELKLMANSAPPDIKNAMFQLTQNGSGQYILCFYLPKVKGTVHECDTKKIKIGSDTFYFKDTGSGVDFYTDEGCTTAADSTKITASYSGSLYSAVPGGITFSAPTSSGYYPVYYFTETSMSADEIKYDIVLEDDFGLASSFGVSSKGEKLTAVNIPEPSTTIPADEDGYARVILSHDGMTTVDTPAGNVTIEYDIYKNNELYEHFSGLSPVTVKIPSGKQYSIQAVAKKNYFIESDKAISTYFNVSRSANYYVSQNGKSPDEGALGTKDSPFRTIQQAVDDIVNQATSFGLDTKGYTINLLTNLKAESLEDYGYSSGYSNYYVYMSCISSPFDNNSDKNLKLLIQGYGGSKVVDANYSGLDSQNAFEGKDYKIATVFNFDWHYQVTLKNLEITGGKGDTNGSSSAIHAAGRMSGCDFNSLTLENVKIYGNTGNRTTYINPVNFAATNVEIYNNDDAGLSGSSAGFQITNRNVSLKNVNIHHNCISNVNKADATTLNGAGLNINSQNVTIEDLIVKNNKIKVKEGSSSVAKGAGVYLNCTPTIKGNCQIFDNEIENADNSKTTSNVYLPTDQTITVGGNLSGCKIGVTTADSPSSGITIPITTGYSTYNDGVPPARIFTSDEGYGVIKDESTGEAVLATGGGSIDVPSQIYDDVKIELDKKVIASKDTSPDKNVISVSGSLDGEPVTLSKLSATLYCHGEEVATYSGNRLTIDMSYPNDTYQLNVTCEYNSKAYSASFDILICDKLNVSMLSAAPESGTYEFSTPAELTKISEFSQSSSLEGVTFELKNDITISGSWTPIGNSTAFKGTLDGCNHKISGLPSSSDALVGIIDGAVIKNLTVAGSSKYAGIIKEAKSGNVENCVSEVTVSSSSFAGGVIGKKTGTETVIVKGCTNTGTVTSTFYGDTSAGAGGIVGCSQRNIQIFNSCNTGDVSAPNCATTINMTPIGAGGIIGNGSGSNNVIISCTNSGKVSSTGYTGGITGNGGKIANCINYGQITGGTFTGGISGGDWTSSGDGYVYIVNCFNIGSVTSNSTDLGHGIGALIGRMRCDGGFGQAIYIMKSFALSGTAVDLIGKYESGTRENNNFVSEEGYSGMIDTLNTFVNTDNKGTPIYNDYKDQFKRWTLKDGKPALVD